MGRRTVRSLVLTQELTSSLPAHSLVKKETYSSLLVDQLNFSSKFKLE